MTEGDKAEGEEGESKWESETNYIWGISEILFMTVFPVEILYKLDRQYDTTQSFGTFFCRASDYVQTSLCG